MKKKAKKPMGGVGLRENVDVNGKPMKKGQKVYK